MVVVHKHQFIYYIFAMSRFRASILHFLISFLAGSILLALFWFVWYPAPMLTAIGGDQIFLLMVGVDVVLGPLLTLVVFNAKKKRILILLDLVIIAAVQISAMVYGVHSILEARPVYVAALGDKFQVVQANEITDENLHKAKTEVPDWGPKWVGTKPPESEYEKNQLSAVTAVGGSRGNLPQLHIPYSEMKTEILQRAQAISLLKKSHPDQAKQIDTWLQEHDHNENNAKYQPIKISASTFVVMLDANDASVLGIASFKP